MGQLLTKSQQQRQDGNQYFERYIAAVEESRNLQRIYVIQEAAKQYLEKFDVSTEKITLFKTLIEIKEKELK